MWSVTTSLVNIQGLPECASLFTDEVVVPLLYLCGAHCFIPKHLLNIVICFYLRITKLKTIFDTIMLFKFSVILSKIKIWWFPLAQVHSASNCFVSQSRENQACLLGMPTNIVCLISLIALLVSPIKIRVWYFLNRCHTLFFRNTNNNNNNNNNNTNNNNNNLKLCRINNYQYHLSNQPYLKFEYCRLMNLPN